MKQTHPGWRAGEHNFTWAFLYWLFVSVEWRQFMRGFLFCFSMLEWDKNVMSAASKPQITGFLYFTFWCDFIITFVIISYVMGYISHALWKNRLFSNIINYLKGPGLVFTFHKHIIHSTLRIITGCSIFVAYIPLLWIFFFFKYPAVTGSQFFRLPWGKRKNDVVYIFPIWDIVKLRQHASSSYQCTKKRCYVRTVYDIIS